MNARKPMQLGNALKTGISSRKVLKQAKKRNKKKKGRRPESAKRREKKKEGEKKSLNRIFAEK